MASQEEIELQKRLNELQQENVRLKRADLDLSFSLVESLKEALGIRSRNTESDRALLKVNKEINRALVNRISAFDTTRSISREIVKNEGLISKAKNIQKGLGESINVQSNDRVKRTLDIFKAQQSVQQQLQDQSELIEKGISVSQGDIKNLEERDRRLAALADTAFGLLGVLEKEYILSQLQTEQLEIQNQEYERRKTQLGATGDILELLSAIPGLGGIARRAVAEINEELNTTGENISGTGALLSATFTKGLEIATNSFVLLSAITAKIFTNFLAINKAQTDFRRITGGNFDNINRLNTSLVTTVDLIEQASSLTETFGVNAQAAFSEFNLQEAAELTQLMGLAADEANNLALFAQTSGDNLNDNVNAIIAQVGKLNVANKTAISQRIILQDIAKVSKAIGVSFEGNTQELASAAQQARILGLNLDQVDQIASNLLDIEQSIAAEFEAEVITGKQLNLERARFFALTNDLEGLTEEIGKNQEVINSFATGTRIEQEAIAGAIGLSRDELAEAIFQQQLQAGITAEQAARTAGLSDADFKRLTIQEKITRSVERLTEALAGPLELFTSIFAQTELIYGLMAGLGTLIITKIVTGLATAAITAGGIGAALNPLAIPLIVGGVVAIGAAIASQISKAKRAGDAIIPSSGGPIISTREGGLIQGTRNDDVIMAPNIANRDDRNRGLTSSDIQAIASAVKEGASNANINLDGGRVSSRLQVPSVINQRQYSY